MKEGKPTKGGKSRGGKSRDAHWKQHTVLLEKEVHLDALDLLRRHYERPLKPAAQRMGETHQPKS
jgi:hypothetical protein